MNPYPTEVLSSSDDDGTMPDNVAELAEAVIGHRIVSVDTDENPENRCYGRYTVTTLTLDNGRKVTLQDTSDCCAYTELEEFFLDPTSVDHMILGVGTTEQYTTWHVYADFGDVMRMKVGWSCGNPFYYGYGFDIQVLEPAVSP